MSILLAIEGAKIKLEPKADWAWQGFEGEISLKASHSLLNIDKKPVLIKTDFPQTHKLGKKTYTTLTHSTPGIIEFVALSVDDKTLSTQVFSKAACLTEKTKGTFQALVTQPALTPNGVADLVLSKSGQWQVVESGQKIMGVEATAPQSVFFDVTISAPASEKTQKQVLAEKTKKDENPEETVDVELFFSYKDGTPIFKAPYKIKDCQGQEFIASLSDKGVACLTVHPGLLEIELGEDVREYKPNRQPQANPKCNPNCTTEQIIQEEPIKEAGIWEIAYDFVSDSISIALKWVGEVLQGDFNKDPTTAQIITNTLITMIPVLDQIGDCRDLTANIITLTDETERDKFENWLILLITLIGMIPTLGSALKGLFKYILKNSGKITKLKLLAVSRILGKGNPEKFLTSLDWEDLTQQSIDIFDKVIDKTQSVIQYLDDLAKKLSEQYAKALSQNLHNLLESLESIKFMSKDKLKEAMYWYKKHIDQLTGAQIKGTAYSTIIKTTVSKSTGKKDGNG
ncbi:MAG: hypothetical protein VSS75_031180 [Candidatus Parabeggiatoa sp.]|nr:hypothetical protein [Candidatus Parabeggiatoa sp.]